MVQRLVLEGNVYLEEHNLPRAYSSYFSAVTLALEKIKSHPQVFFGGVGNLSK
jgi:hypothetical protein